MPNASKNRDFQQGWRVDRTAKGHYMFKSPDGRITITAGGSYGDPKAIKNFVARLRRAGLHG